MPFCRKCGLELEPDDSFCPNCGAVITSTSQRRIATEATDASPSFTGPVKETSMPQPAPAPKGSTHTKQGTMGLLMGIIGLAVYFIPINPSDALFVAIIDMFVGGIAADWGSKGHELGDKNGMIAMILGLIIVILCIYTIWISM